MGVIVVGVDQSEGAKAALRFARDEAELRHATLRVVHAWQYGYIGLSGFEGAYPAVAADLDELREAAKESLNALLRESIPDASTVVIEPRVVEGRAASVLVEESRDATMLVVGSRGHGGFTDLLLGSVSHQCANHASCPVLIVRAQSEESH